MTAEWTDRQAPGRSSGAPDGLAACGPGQVADASASVSVLDAVAVQPAAEATEGRQSVAPPLRTVVCRRGRRLTLRWPLLVVLGVQVVLSARLAWSNTAFQDEALYLRAGHLEWARLLHGIPIPDFAAYFSGAPVLYPPIGALADSAGGLAAARLLSLCFMLAVTVLLWLAARRLFGLRVALLATALFATLAGTQFLGALATYDSLALLLLAFAVWLAVRASDCRPRGRLLLLVAAGLTLSLADAVKYATSLFTPVVLVVAALAIARQQGRRAGLQAALTLTSCWLALVAAAIGLGGEQYWHGITTSTISRPVSDATTAIVLQRAYVWTGLILVLAVLGTVLALRGRAGERLLPAALAGAALLVPVAQARLHTTISLQKHVVFGAWFAAIAAGYALARLSRVDRGRGWAPVMAIPIAASTLFGTLGQADTLYRAWPNSAQVVGVLRDAVRAYPGIYLAEDFDVEAYYLRDQVPWQRWSSTYYFRYPGAGTGASAYKAAIASHYFSLIILDFRDAKTDSEITADMVRAGGYFVLARSGRFMIWASDERGQAVRAGSYRGSG